MTRQHCQAHNAAFLQQYGHLTRCVPINIYAIAAQDSLVDFGNYVQVLQKEIEFVTLYNPLEFGLLNVEGAIQTGERHIVIREARKYFEGKLKKVLKLKTDSIAKADWYIDCTFCAEDSSGVDRYEPCVTALMKGPVDKAITIMDGPFPSLYPWDEANSLCSLTSAKYTPLTKCDTWDKAKAVLEGLDKDYIDSVCHKMIESMEYFWPAIKSDYSLYGHKLAIRAMPRSGADARLVEVRESGKNMLRIRAGKIDAVLHAESLVFEKLGL